jgi:hypothetical protein
LTQLDGVTLFSMAPLMRVSRRKFLALAATAAGLALPVYSRYGEPGWLRIRHLKLLHAGAPHRAFYRSPP